MTWKEAMKTLYYATLSVLKIVTLMGLAIVTARMRSEPATQIPIRGAISTAPLS